MKYSTDSFFDIMYLSRDTKPMSQYCTEAEFADERKKRQTELRKVIGLDRLETINHTIKSNHVSERRYEVEILPGLVMPVWILKPGKPNGKTVLYLPGHDNKGALGSFNYYGQNHTFHKWLPLQLQFEGFTVVIPELMGFGELMKDNYTESYKGCYANTEILQMFGISMAGMRTYQALCTIKLMETEIERPMNFIYGISGGGLIAMLTSALSDKPEAVVISNYGASFKSSIMEIQHCVDNYVPNILNIGECADILALSAPTPLMLTNGIHDTIFPADGVKNTVEELKKIYSMLNANDNFVNHFHDGGHETDSDSVIAFLKSYITEEQKIE